MPDVLLDAHDLSEPELLKNLPKQAGAFDGPSHDKGGTDEVLGDVSGHSVPGYEPDPGRSASQTRPGVMAGA
jgi:hypothetical protein